MAAWRPEPVLRGHLEATYIAGVRHLLQDLPLLPWRSPFGAGGGAFDRLRDRPRAAVDVLNRTDKTDARRGHGDPASGTAGGFYAVAQLRDAVGDNEEAPARVPLLRNEASGLRVFLDAGRGTAGLRGFLA